MAREVGIISGEKETMAIYREGRMSARTVPKKRKLRIRNEINQR
ncbi:hypothetical protein MTY_2095 [Moorella thermoacetica Y72]|uniref:Uncharacterized protein n=1 Tax=Moorella thermoacetica Y72 TaxID=1325331 RepID=A0A0S6UG63_NEOTH|nr:hypothetical protein MTY_2095 [Moorella thermoacetica Y72]